MGLSCTSDGLSLCSVAQTFLCEARGGHDFSSLLIKMNKHA